MVRKIKNLFTFIAIILGYKDSEDFFEQNDWLDQTQFKKWLLSNVKLFTDDTLIFSVVRYSGSSLLSLNEDLSKTSQWGYKWKMLFNPDALKQAQEIVFSRKKIHLTIVTSTSITCR